jgi:hypothetical protein
VAELTRRVAAAAACALLVASGAAGCSDDDSDDADSSSFDPTSTTLATGGMDVDAPDGWRAIPLPQLGFGLALPSEWEALVLSDEGLSSVSQATPLVPGFADAAHAAAATGSVFYAAGVDADDRVTDLKVRAAPTTGVTDAPGLQTYAQELLTEAGITDATVETVEGTDHPTVQVRYQTEAERPNPDDPEAAPTKITVEGTEHLVLSPRGVVYSLIVTSEVAEGHDSFAEAVFSTLTFP